MINNFNENIIHTTALYDKADTLHKQKLASDPDNVSLLWELVVNTHQQGQLDTARRYCHQLLALQPDHPAARHMHHLLQEIKSTQTTDGVPPVPFIRRVDFLCQDQQKAIWEYIHNGLNDFTPSKVTSGDPESRKSDVLQVAKAIRSWFLPHVIDLTKQKLDYFHLADLDIGRKELEVTRHGHQQYFKKHSDTSYLDKCLKTEQQERTRSRKISFVYYFHRLPKPFMGGDLLLFDTDITTNSSNLMHTRIAPTHNRIILFRSPFNHQVTSISLEPDTFLQGRFTLNGWISTPKHD